MFKEDIANLDRQIEELCARKAELEAMAEAKRREEENKKMAEKNDELSAIKKAIDEFNAKYGETLTILYKPSINSEDIWKSAFPDIFF